MKLRSAQAGGSVPIDRLSRIPNSNARMPSFTVWRPMVYAVRSSSSGSGRGGGASGGGVVWASITGGLSTSAAHAAMSRHARETSQYADSGCPRGQTAAHGRLANHP